ncbi:hypothetical protein CENSYa_1990 [Cenarchaeum symbiosum A]|uniref:Carbonic anhydrase n=1 Tax=Cenarchaeum symbiosum (strain A) TaxID=414004 RepID=A0RZ27_CENSY|nr:hypothetical protein CENSYa_1990 [Cenarchaeum symbiosum A]
MATGTFATSVSCIDGRIQGPVSEWIREKYNVDYVDTITEPGLDKRISAPETAEALRKKVVISIKAHKSKTVIVSGHADCAANPVSAEEHAKDIAEGVRLVKSWDLGVKVEGIWVDDGRNVSLI